MLAYFPKAYPDELLYSILARYHLHTGSPSPIHTMESLFGRRLTVASVDLQGALGPLVERLPNGSNWTPDRLINEHSIFPYYAAYQPAVVVARARRALIRGDDESVMIRLGLATFLTKRVTQLRFCSQCHVEMRRQHGELYWRRTHQLPGVCVCPLHGCSLKLSSVRVSEVSRHRFVPATTVVCPWHSPDLIDIDDRERAALLGLAKTSQKLLEGLGGEVSYASLSNQYRQSIVAIGLGRGSLHIDQVALRNRFLSHHSQIRPAVPELLSPNAIALWLPAMVRKHRKAFHPLQHLLLQDFVASQEVVANPFGVGPWECRNPLASHFERTVVTGFSVHRNRGHSVGVFECECGYRYTRTLYQGAEQPESPRFLSYGPLLRPALTKLVADGQSLRSVSRALRLDPKTVSRLATELGLSAKWAAVKVADFQPRDVISRASAVERSREPTQPVKAKSARVNWSARDDDVLEKVRSAAADIQAKSPPSRVTTAAIERQHWNRGWLSKRSAKLPQSMRLVRELTESVEQFQLRRAAWVVREIANSGEALVAWKVLRKAGLKNCHMSHVECLLEGQVGRQRRRHA